MGEDAISKLPVGSRCSLLVNINQMDQHCFWGSEIPSGSTVAFQHVGWLDDVVTLYDVVKSGKQDPFAIWLTLDSQSSILGHHTPQSSDFKFAHDVCCGLGGFSSAFHFLGGQVISAVDSASLAVEAYACNHPCKPLCADIRSSQTVRLMHQEQLKLGCQPLLTAGFPCQPFSRQGLKKGLQDPRGQILPAIFKAAKLLHVCGVLLECVPDVLSNMDIQHLLYCFALEHGFRIQQFVLHLHHVWPSKRSRWFALLVRNHLPAIRILPFSEPLCLPTIKDLITVWPAWPQSEEQQLQWTELEQQVFNDPAFGNPNRRVVVTEPLPTALHSWGSQIYACPCQCRNHGFSLQTLLKGGLRGVEFRSVSAPFASRHIHPKELQALLGFLPFEQCLPNCRAALCLFGNSVSPLQGLWIFAQIFQTLGLCTGSADEVLAEYTALIRLQMTLSWPPQTSSTFRVLVSSSHGNWEFRCASGTKVKDFFHAQCVFEQSQISVQLCYAGVGIPLDAFLQPLTYELSECPAALGCSLSPVRFLLSHLGATSLCVGPPGVSLETVLKWLGFVDWHSLTDLDGNLLCSRVNLFDGMHVVVRRDPQDIAFELAVKESVEGLGFGPNLGQLRTSSSWYSTGLSHIDALIKNQLLVSWVASGFLQLTVWLPSFAAATLEIWPSTADELLRVWFERPEVVIRVIVLESWGWNLIELRTRQACFEVFLFEPSNCCAVEAPRVAWRAYQFSGCTSFRSHANHDHDVGEPGSLSRIFQILDIICGVPKFVASALHSLPEEPSLPGLWCSGVDLISATLPLDDSPSQLPVTPGSPTPPNELQGLSAPFILDFARALIVANPVAFTSQQIKVICIGSDCPDLDRGTWGDVQFCYPPLFVFVLANSHWTFLLCAMTDSTLHIPQFDGLAQTSLSVLKTFADHLQTVWNAASYVLSTTWEVEQTKPDSCGTIALAHFALKIGSISLAQAKDFESLHRSFAECSRITPKHGLSLGFGNEEEAAIAALAQILPAKGVPQDAIRDRALAAIKALGVGPISKALSTKNPWAALKAAGSSRPRPFMWITHEELQAHIQSRAESKFGVDVDQRKPRSSKDKKKPVPVSAMLDPASLVLPSAIFASNDGTALAQIAVSEVQKNARGVAFCTPTEAKPFLTEGKFVSTDALALLVVGTLLSDIQHSLPSHAVRVPAIYKGTQEPVLLDCISIQLGDLAVYRKSDSKVPEAQVFPTSVFRAHIYQDLWTAVGDWNALISRPIKSLTATFAPLRLCRSEQCDEQCGQFHPSIEEHGVEAAILDVWGYHWHTTDGTKATPGKATVLSVYIRVLESNFNTVHALSGQAGVFFEPRANATPGGDPNFSVIWLPHASLADVQHKVRTHDQLIAVCRLGNKFGVRCLAKHEEVIYKELCPAKPFVKCTVREIYRLEPLPAGIQKQSLIEFLQNINWGAKPLQPCRGSQGQAWTVGSDGPPPVPFFETKHGWVTITKVKDTVSAPTPQHIVATVRTRQHIREGASSSSTSPSVDPWSNPEVDPWAKWTGPKVAPIAPNTAHLQSKLDDVEQRLHDSVLTQVSQSFEQHHKADLSNNSDRLSAVESQLSSLANHQLQLEQWCGESDKKITALQEGQMLTNTQVGHCVTQIKDQAAVLNQVSHEIGGIKTNIQTSLQSYFDEQTNRLEALLSKKQRHE